MARGKFHEEQDSQDSFLDVVANVVGVLIILVMLVGMQASTSVMANRETETPDSPQETSSASAEPGLTIQDLAVLQSELEASTKDALNQKRRVAKLADQVVNLVAESVAQDQLRNELALHQRIVEQEIDRRRQELDKQDQEEFDVQRQLLDLKLKLSEYEQERISLASAPGVVEEIENVPTPLARVVDEPSIHLRLRNGLVSIVPYEALSAEARQRTRQIMRRLQSTDKVVESFGPIDGYRAIVQGYRITRNPTGGTTVGQRIRSTTDFLVTFVPVNEELGETVERAINRGSEIYEYLQSRRRDSPPVDVWLYPDSYDEFRVLKKALWEMGFAVSTRPLNSNSKISASVHGSKSAVQ